jgi:hypothetical protein
VGGADCARKSVVRHSGNLPRLRFRKRGVGSHDRERSVFDCGAEGALERAFPYRAGRIEPAAPFGQSRASYNPSRPRVNHVAESVDHGKRAYRRASRQSSRSSAYAPRRGEQRSGQLSHRRPGTRADSTFFDPPASRLLARAVSHRGIGPRERAAHGKIEYHRGGNDRHARGSGGETDIVLFEKANHSAGRIEPENRAARQDDRVRALHEIAGG